MNIITPINIIKGRIRFVTNFHVILMIFLSCVIEFSVIISFYVNFRSNER